MLKKSQKANKHFHAVPQEFGKTRTNQAKFSRCKKLIKTRADIKHEEK